ncbi:hypothetical protein BDF20DRAFT_822612 [Mycotypha africana]|uniref:uncharacterized protein n=1 Tax=Mycotypha africana TaxID=64632 RepID=UPI002301708E|nr:uncharacterized protein BDF20DRAFT_822612 [Mycotypha africana]KAI8975696.1 hypothetical protein BDF20DRAFT_822612 [Mycotypha africana]
MGATESKPQQEPVIIYNPNVPLQFTPNLINSMEKKAEQLPARVESRQMEDIINKRVKEELEKIKKAEHSLQQKFYLELSEKNQSNEAGSKETLDDVETMIQRIMRSGTKELPPKVKECQEQVIQCYRYSFFPKGHVLLRRYLTVTV